LFDSKQISQEFTLDLIRLYSQNISTKEKERRGKRKKPEKQKIWTSPNTIEKFIKNNISLQNTEDGIRTRCGQFGGIIQQ